MENEKEYYSIEEVAKRWGCDNDAVYALVKKNKLIPAINYMGVVHAIDTTYQVDHPPLSFQDDAGNVQFEDILIKGMIYVNLPEDVFSPIEIGFTSPNTLSSKGFDLSPYNYSSESIGYLKLLSPIYSPRTNQLYIISEMLNRFEKKHDISAQELVPEEIVPVLPIETDDKQSHQNSLSDKREENMLRTIGALSLLLTEKSKLYGKDHKPNASAIANEISELIDRLDVTGHGQSKSTLATLIPRGVKTLLEE